MRYLLISVMFVFASCRDCVVMYDTTSDNQKCWKECAQSATTYGLEFNYNFQRCLETGCGYPHQKQCK